MRRLLGSGTDGPVESAVSRRAHADAVAGKRIVVDAWSTHSYPGVTGFSFRVPSSRCPRGLRGLAQRDDPVGSGVRTTPTEGCLMTAMRCTCSTHLDFSAGQTRYPVSSPFVTTALSVLS